MTEASDLNTALHKVLKAAFCQLNLARGINESCRAIEEYHNGDQDNKSALCILANDVEVDGYKKLIVALCAEQKVPLVITNRSLSSRLTPRLTSVSGLDSPDTTPKAPPERLRTAELSLSEDGQNQREPTLTSSSST